MVTPEERKQIAEEIAQKIEDEIRFEVPRVRIAVKRTMQVCAAIARRCGEGK